ncbi:MAG: hypothetical protein ACQEUT_18025 [Bacillota bacterium]
MMTDKEMIYARHTKQYTEMIMEQRGLPRKAARKIARSIIQKQIREAQRRIMQREKRGKEYGEA